MSMTHGFGGGHVHHLNRALKLGYRVAQQYRHHQRQRARNMAPDSEKPTGGITNQFDERVLYRAKGKHRGRSKSAKHAAQIRRAMADLPIGQYSFTEAAAALTCSTGGQNYFSVSLFGVDASATTNHGTFGNSGTTLGTAGMSKGHIRNLFNDEDNNLSANYTVDPQLCRADVYVTNTGSQTLVMDIYEIVCRKDVTRAQEQSNLGYGDIQDMFGNIGFGSTINTGGSQPTSTGFGTTPFQGRVFCEYWKIVKKTRILLSAAQAWMQQFKQHRPKYLTNQQYSEYAGYTAKRGLTKGLLFIYYGADAAHTAVTLDATVHYYLKAKANTTPFRVSQVL